MSLVAPSAACVLGSVTADDAEELTAVGFPAWADTPFGAAHGGFGNDGFRQAFLSFCAEEPHIILAARRGGRIIGWGARDPGDSLVQDLWVAGDAQGQGIGRLILAALEQAMIADGLAVSELETFAANTGAIGFYRHLGYVEQWHRLQMSGALGYEIDKIGFSKPLTSRDFTAQ